MNANQLNGGEVERHLSHISIAVPDIEAARAQFEEIFGLAVGPVAINEREGVKLAYVQLANTRIELITPCGESPVRRFLEKNPRGGLHHICLRVTDIEGAISRIERAGGASFGAISTNVLGERIAFVHPRSVCGVLFELEEGKKSEAT